MNMRTAPNWDNFLCRKMSIPFFIYGRDDLQVGPLEGFCRGCGGEKSYVACLSMCGGLPVIDPATGIMRTPTLTDRELSQ